MWGGYRLPKGSKNKSKLVQNVVLNAVPLPMGHRGVLAAICCCIGLQPFAILQPFCIISLPLILARLCGHEGLCEYKLMSLFALGAPRVASCENSHQRFPVRPCLYRYEGSQVFKLRGRPPNLE